MQLQAHALTRLENLGVLSLNERKHALAESILSTEGTNLIELFVQLQADRAPAALLWDQVLAPASEALHEGAARPVC